jgi:hypothetical protein
MPFTLFRHSGMILAGIQHKQRPKNLDSAPDQVRGGMT